MKIIWYILIIFLCLVFILPAVLSLGGINVLPGKGSSGSAGVSGALIRSGNAGADWTSPSFSGHAVPSSIFDIAFHPTNPDVMLAGTKGAGIWKSNDQGLIWEQMPDQAGVLQASADVYKIAISAASSSVLYAAVYQGGKGRVLKSEDNGNHFREVYFVTADRYGVFDVYADPADAGTVLAATGEGLLLKSQDGARTWRVAHNFGESIVLLAVNPVFSGEMYALTERRKLFKTFDAGATWIDLSGDGASTEGGGWEKTGYVYQGKPTIGRIFQTTLSDSVSLAINPHNPAQLYRGTNIGLLHSENGGFSWEVKDALFEQKDFPPRGIAFDPQNPDRVWVASGQKISQSENRGATWSVKAIPGSVPVKKLFIHPRKSEILFLLLGK